MLLTRPGLRSLVAIYALATLGSAASMSAEVSATATSTDATSASASKTTSTSKATHTVQVGPKTNPHAYVPHNLTANVGDVVVFEFYPTNHSVVKADYLAPCVPASDGLFYSGIFNTFNTNNGDLVGPAPTWSIVINDTEPTYFYCTAIGSCLENGMVGVINPNSTRTYKAQYDRALTYPYMLVPGQDMPAEGNGEGSTTSPTSTSTSTSSSDSSNSGGHGLSKGAIAGIAVAGAAFLIILVALFFLLGRNRVYKKWMSSEDGRNERTARWAMFSHPTSGGAESWNRKSEVGSNLGKPAMTDTTSVSSPDPNRFNTVSPPLGDGNSSYGTSSPRQISGQWNWDPSFGARMNRGPSELEGNTTIHQLPESRDER